jgi:putative nucleotidyltransferase with HDIG domain
MTETTTCCASAQWTRALHLVDSLPPLSPLARHLLATITSPTETISLREVAGWIEKDPLTTGKVLSLANTAWYSRGAPILSVRHAVARLGLNPLRNLILSMSMGGFSKRLPTPSRWSATRFNKHCVATAVLSEMIANALAPRSMEVAFLAGLFHDLGRLIIVVLMHDNPEGLDRLIQEEHLRLEEVERELLGFSHSELSAVIVKSWNLPEAVETAVRFHENPEDDPGRNESNPYPLSTLVHAADCFIDCHGFSISDDTVQDEAAHQIFEKLGLATDDSPLTLQFRDELDILLKIL